MAIPPYEPSRYVFASGNGRGLELTGEARAVGTRRLVSELVELERELESSAKILSCSISPAIWNVFP